MAKKRKKIVIYDFPLPQTFLPLFDGANGLLSQERLLNSRSFATMGTRRRIYSFYCYLSFLFYLFFACVLKLPTNIQISLNYIQRRHLKKQTTHNYTHSGLSSKDKNIENYIFYILAKLDVKISSINNTDQSCLLFFFYI